MIVEIELRLSSMEINTILSTEYCRLLQKILNIAIRWKDDIAARYKIWKKSARMEWSLIARSTVEMTQFIVNSDARLVANQGTG